MRGVNTTVVRLAQIHDTHKQGLVPYVTAVGAGEGCVGLHWRGRKPLAGGACHGHRAAVSAGGGEGGGRARFITRWMTEGVSMKAIAEALGRGLKVPGEEHHAGGGSSALWVAGDVCGDGYAVVQRDYAEDAGMEADGAWVDTLIWMGWIIRRRKLGTHR